MKKDTLNKLFIHELKDILCAEEQICKALPECIKASQSVGLKEALKNHLEESNIQVQRLEQIFSLLGISERSESCEAMTSLINECIETINNYEKSALRDAALIAKLQRIEHYEISVYGTLRTFAKILDLEDIVELLKETLDEELAADRKLTKIAEGGLLTTGVNQQANR